MNILLQVGVFTGCDQVGHTLNTLSTGIARYIERHLRPILERIQDHPAKRINELLPWVYQAMIDAQKVEAEVKHDAGSDKALMLTLHRVFFKRREILNGA